MSNWRVSLARDNPNFLFLAQDMSGKSYELTWVQGSQSSALEFYNLVQTKFADFGHDGPFEYVRFGQKIPGTFDKAGILGEVKKDLRL